jgi:hypothetical protein
MLMDTLLIVVLGTILIALAVDLAAVIGWVCRGDGGEKEGRQCITTKSFGVGFCGLNRAEKDLESEVRRVRVIAGTLARWGFLRYRWQPTEWSSPA